MITLSQVSCFLRGQSCLHEVSLSFTSGLVALIGANGAGKSTLLHLLADGGRHYPSAKITGSLELEGQALRTFPSQALAQRRAFLPQQHSEQLPLAVHDIVMLACWPFMQPSQTAALHADALQRWDLEHLAHRSWQALSGGERQRVQLARTWLQLQFQTQASQRIWLLDEPQNALDLPHQQSLKKQLHEEARPGALVVFSTHDINFALHNADRVIALGNGQILADGNAQELADPALLQHIFGVPFEALTPPESEKPWLVPRSL